MHGTWAPVPTEQNADREELCIVSEVPGPSEVRERRPLIGRSWEDAMLPALAAQGITRSQVRIGNALLCRPPDQDLEKLRLQIGKENRKRTEHNKKLVGGTGAVSGKLLPLIPDPTECCRPQLVHTVRTAPNVLVAGITPWLALTSEKRSMRDIRGAFVERHLTPTGAVLRPVELPGGGGFVPPPANAQALRLTPTWNPAYALRAPEWAPVFKHDVGRWVRWVRGELRWVPAKLVRNPSYGYLQQFLYSDHVPYLAVDIETDSVDDLTTNIRVIGFSDGEYSFVVHFRSIKPPYRLLGDEPAVLRGEATGWYGPAEAAAIRSLIRRYLTDDSRLKIGHNFNYFDTGVLCRTLDLPEIRRVYDSIMLFRSAYTELPRGLYTLGTMTTDVPDWKATNDDVSVAEGARTDEELAVYNGTDCVVNYRAMPRLIERVKARGQAHLVQFDLEIQRRCRYMHRLGMRIDQTKRLELEQHYGERIEVRTQQIRDRVGSNTFNPNSTQQLGRLLYQDWGFPVTTWTETFDPSTNDEALRAAIVQRHGTAEQREVVQLIRAQRTDMKRYGALVPLRMWNDYRRDHNGHLVGGLCRADGRVHPHYNAHTPATARISSSEPNSQNQEKILRVVFIPEDGNTYVGADYDQIELRLISGVAGVQGYIDVFNAGGDPHAVTAKLVYGAAFEKVFEVLLCPKCLARYKRDGIMRKLEGCDKLSKPPADAPDKAKARYAVWAAAYAKYETLRNFAKTFVYAVIYGATPETLFASVASAENPDGTLAFPDMTLGMVTAAHNAWMAGAKEIPLYWNTLLQQAAAFGYVSEPIAGRVRDCPGGPVNSRNEILNFPIQGGAAVIVGRAVLRATERIPYDFDARTGLVNYMHDAVTFEVPESRGREVIEILDEVLPAREQATPAILYSAKAQLAANLKEAA